MTDYKKIADIMMQHSLHNPSLKKRDFMKEMKLKGYTFIKTIDKVAEGVREVWGNKSNEIIVLKNPTSYRML